MLDFLLVASRSTKKGSFEIYPKFVIKKSADLMIRGGDFYAIWVEERGFWSTDEQDALQLIDRELDEYKKENVQILGADAKVLHMWDSENGMIDRWHKYCQKHMRDHYHMLDEKLIFLNTETTKKDYASKKLDYPLEEGDISAWDRLMSTLYAEDERMKIEWAIGSIVSGDSKKLQKFVVLYGAAGTGKSTVLHIIEDLFKGYWTAFNAKNLSSASNAFALEAFKNNPLVAIQHDGDLSKIKDNTQLNSLVSHEIMTVNEKFKSTYSNEFKCFLFMGTNSVVDITDAKSGLIRRLIDVRPTGNKVPTSEYNDLRSKINFELGAIAFHCKDLYLKNKHYYDSYIPQNMMAASNDFYNFMSDHYIVFENEDGVSQKAAWKMYKDYCTDANIQYPLTLRVFKEEIKNYFREHHERFNLLDGTRVRSYYSGFRTEKFEEFTRLGKEEEQTAELIEFKDDISSVFDEECSECAAQYSSAKETPLKKWADVKTTLRDIDTRKLHYVKVPINHIVIDFDIPDEQGNKCFERNLREASKWPSTYAELSKSGAGIHLHYIYTGDPEKLSRVYDDHIEVKVFTGNSSLRRKLTKCNKKPIAKISSNLPLKGDKKMVNFDAVKNEKGIRTLIKRNLCKEIHPGTKPSVDFIHKILEEAYESGMPYDVSDMRPAVLSFAAASTHQSDYCIKLVAKMHFKSDEASESCESDDDKLIFYDIEVFPNLFLVNWKIAGEEKPVVRMVNPSAEEIENLMKYRLVGFNCRKYDNHILYARTLGYDNKQIFELSRNIVNGEGNHFFREAYNISYTDILDFSADKQSLKKWEIEMANISVEDLEKKGFSESEIRIIKKGGHHQELGLPWDQPVPEEQWSKVAEYCDNDVICTEALFVYLKGDFTAREILADIGGGTVNNTTNALTTKTICGNEKPELVYTDLATGKQYVGDLPEKTNDKHINKFPGYEFVRFGKDGHSHNMYRGEDVGFGGYVFAVPGMYGRTVCYDVSGMHPASIRALNLFGDLTKNFGDIVDARLAIKHKDYDKARQMFGGKLAKYLDDESQAKSLASALKIAVNSVYGLTSASFDNPFRDIRNVNNIVALRGALFMVNLKHEVQDRGFKVIHIKTDSIKVVNPTPELEQFIFEYGRKYDYNFEIEHIFEKICLVNDAVYIGKLAADDPNDPGKWSATGKQFAVSYLFKKLFSHKEIVFEDMCETFSVKKGALYLDMNENLPDVREHEKEFDKVKTAYKKGKLSDTTFESEAARLQPLIDVGHSYHFVGRVGQFCPIKPGNGGGVLYRICDDKPYAAAGSTGYRWLESELVRRSGGIGIIDTSFYERLVDEAVTDISKFGDFEWFVSDDHSEDFMNIPDGMKEEVPFEELPF